MHASESLNLYKMAFYAPSAFNSALKHYDISAGDRFYDTPAAYQKWGEALKHVRRSILVTFALQGRDNVLTFQIETYDSNKGWSTEPEMTTTQFEFKEMLYTHADGNPANPRISIQSPGLL